MKKETAIKNCRWCSWPKIADNNWFYIQAKRALPIIKLISHLIPILPLRLNVTVQRNISRWELLSQRSTQRRFCLILIDFHKNFQFSAKSHDNTAVSSWGEFFGWAFTPVHLCSAQVCWGMSILWENIFIIQDGTLAFLLLSRYGIWDPRNVTQCALHKSGYWLTFTSHWAHCFISPTLYCYLRDTLL